MNAQAQAERVDDSNLASGGREGEHRKKEKKLKVDPLRVPSATLITKAESVHPHIGKDKEEERNGVVQHANVLIYPGFIVIQEDVYFKSKTWLVLLLHCIQKEKNLSLFKTRDCEIS